MGHVLAKTIIITKVIELIAEKYKITLSEARDRLYNSRTMKLIDDDEMGFYGESPLYVYSVYLEEQEMKKEETEKKKKTKNKK